MTNGAVLLAAMAFCAGLALGTAVKVEWTAPKTVRATACVVDGMKLYSTNGKCPP